MKKSSHNLVKRLYTKIISLILESSKSSKDKTIELERYSNSVSKTFQKTNEKSFMNSISTSKNSMGQRRK